jgi:alpha-L-rhamnosidase
MWQFKAESGKAYLYPHVYKDGKFVNNSSIAKIEIPANAAFDIGDTVEAQINCDGDTVTTSIKVGEDYVVIDERDMSEYGFDEGTVGVRTGGKESGRLYAMEICHNDGGLLYSSNFAGGENPFSKCTIADGALVVSKALSAGDLLDRDAAKDFASNKSSDSFVFLRTELALTDAQLAKLDRALLSVTATSPETTRQFVYNMYVNGTIVGVGPSRYGKTPAGKTELYYNTYDVTELLKAGDNCLAAINYTTAGRAFLSQLTLHYTDGTSEIVSNSAGVQ